MVRGSWLAGALLLVLGRTAVAAEPPVGPVTCTERVAQIRSTVQRALRNDRIWSYTWAGGMAGLVTANAVLSQVGNREDRVDYYFGLGGSSLGLVAVLVGPFGEMRRLSRLRTTLDLSTGNPCAIALSAEREMAEVARLERRAHSWFVHLGNLVVNAGLGVGLGAGYGHWRAAFIQMAVGSVIGEVQILTRPRTTDTGLKTLQLQPMGMGLALVASF